MDSQDYLEVKVPVLSEEQAEIVEALVSDLGFDSFQYEPGSVKCYIQSGLFDEAALRDALEFMPSFDGGFEVSQMPSEDWNAEWEATGFTPIVVERVIISPATAEGAAEAARLEAEIGSQGSEPVTIWLSPKMAFGTGHHNTTRMMIETMQELASVIEGAAVMDLGCGTAVLAILAAKLGAGEVYAIDIDATAVRSSQGNVALNSEDFQIECSDASGLKPQAYDVLLANIHRNIIIADLPRYARAVRAGGRLLLSGFFDTDVSDIVAAAEASGFALAGRRLSDGWACLSLIRM